ncbi:arginine transporter [Yoonia sp. 208BN28-4]|uniref:arginine transporter n=1 Tax=Yoonia sp. 208BN28-4 TaxID=3126505 RepID=UPI0030B745B5
MQRIFIALSFTALAACSGGSGQISQACLDADRRAATPQLCSCVQRAADRTLSSSDQTLAAGFFEDPQEAQDIRQRGIPSTSAFWRRYTAFANDARRNCR